MSTPPADDVAAVQQSEKTYNKLRDELSKVIVGQNAVIEQVLVAICARGRLKSRRPNSS
jgi:MoxR-like ATPase